MGTEVVLDFEIGCYIPAPGAHAEDNAKKEFLKENEPVLTGRI